MRIRNCVHRFLRRRWKMENCALDCSRSAALRQAEPDWNEARSSDLNSRFGLRERPEAANSSIVRLLFLRGHLLALAPRFGEPDGDGLFATGNLLAAAARFQLAPLHLMHFSLDILACRGRVFAAGGLLR